MPIILWMYFVEIENGVSGGVMAEMLNEMDRN